MRFHLQEVRSLRRLVHYCRRVAGERKNDEINVASPINKFSVDNGNHGSSNSDEGEFKRIE
jgi:hypothetical protein